MKEYPKCDYILDPIPLPSDSRQKGNVNQLLRFRMTVMKHANIQEAELNANGNIHYGNFRIIIVGGSVSGLSLANICERLGIDYVVLEAHPKIAPGKGQSVAFHPPRSRILDQLGCFQPLVDLVEFPLQNVTLRQEGRLLQKSYGVGEHILERQVT